MNYAKKLWAEALVKLAELNHSFMVFSNKICIKRETKQSIFPTSEEEGKERVFIPWNTPLSEEEIKLTFQRYENRLQYSVDHESEIPRKRKALKLLKRSIKPDDFTREDLLLKMEQNTFPERAERVDYSAILPSYMCFSLACLTLCYMNTKYSLIPEDLTSKEHTLEIIGCFTPLLAFAIMQVITMPFYPHEEAVPASKKLLNQAKDYRARIEEQLEAAPKHIR